ncbi:hypothetical protein H4S08_003678 [Coemansia sp. RSA 1365]|nr:hypothetical protein H4S08_003678 [Coemansia sp. RSA 1365]
MFFVYLLRSVYALLAGLAIAFELAPCTREAFVKYGKTRVTPTIRGGMCQSWPAVAARLCASATVSKNLFSQFYYVGAAVGSMLMLDLVCPPRSGLPRSFQLLEAGLRWISRSDIHAAVPDRIALLGLGMFNVHVFVRLKESALDQPATGARMHVGQYAVGLLFYFATPFALVVDWCYGLGRDTVPLWMVIAGLALFSYASLHQSRCHQILYRLRRQGLQKRQSQPKEQLANLYALPYGDLFDHVLCPHYLCEIFIYASIWITTGCKSITIMYVVMWTLINLAITARETQQWYCQVFGDRIIHNRPALVPFIW